MGSSLAGRPFYTYLAAPLNLLNTEVKRIKESRNVESEQKLLGTKLTVYVEWEQSKKEGRPHTLRAYYRQRTFIDILSLNSIKFYILELLFPFNGLSN